MGGMGGRGRVISNPQLFLDACYTSFKWAVFSSNHSLINFISFNSFLIFQGKKQMKRRRNPEIKK